MKGAALAPPFSCTTKYSSDVYSPRPPDIRVRLLPTKPPVHFTTEQPGRDIVRCCHRKYIKGTIQFVVPKIVGRDTVNQKYLKEKYAYLVASLLWQIYLPVQLPRPMVRFTSSVALQSTILGNICLLDPARLCRRAY